MNLFELQDVTFRYQDVVALDGLTLAFPEGSRIALVGANGSGKSTLLRVLDGLYFPEAGRVSYRGEPLTEAQFGRAAFARAFRRRVGLVFQNPDVQLFNPTVFDEVAFAPLTLGLPRDEVRDRVMRALQFMRIEPLADRAPHRLSGGEKKRVAIASVLSIDPEVILLDEPTATLDPRSQSQIIDLLAGWSDGKSVITATHDLTHLVDVADRCIVMDGGRVAADRSPGDVLADDGLLDRTNLIHAHRHRHGEHGHSHPHVHAR